MRPSRVVIVTGMVLGACSGDDAPACVDTSCGADASAGDAGLGTEHFTLLSEPRIGAKSGTKSRVIALGTQASGAVATDPLVLGFDRPGAGAYTQSLVTLGNLGATSYFEPCDISVPGCLGPLTLTAARASAPTTPIASVAVELVDPLEVNPARRCLGGGDTLYVKGDDQVLTGEHTFTDATWAFDEVYDEYLVFRVTPAGSTETWRLTFDTRVYSPYMIPDAYENAQTSHVIASNLEIDHPALDIRVAGRLCGTQTGRFDVVEYARDNNGAVVITMAFEQRCTGNPTQKLTGCVHYRR